MGAEDDGVQGTAQIMSHDAQHIVTGPGGAARGLVQPGVLHRQTGEPAQPLGELQIRLGVAASGLGGDEHQRPEPPLLRPERHAHEGARLQPPEQLEVPGAL